MKKEKAETVVYAFATFFTIVGAGLAVAGILLPYWYEASRQEGIVIFRADIGVWQDRICAGDTGCENHWYTEDDYDRHEEFKIPKLDLIRYFETAGCGVALFTILAMIPVWATHMMGSSKCFKRSAFTLFFFCVMVAGMLCEVGVLILASEIETDESGWAPFLCGIGGGLLFIAGSMSCAVCRYDPSYGTLENPVSPTFLQA